MRDEQLLRLAELHGIATGFEDVWQQWHEVSVDSLRALLAAMGVAADDDAAITASLHERERSRWRRMLPPTVVAPRAGLPAGLRLQLPAEFGRRRLTWRIREEGGEEHAGEFDPQELELLEEHAVPAILALRLVLPDAMTRELAYGYHRLEILDAGERLAATRLIVVPERCFEPDALRGSGRLWGGTVQLYSLRSERNWGIGDFTDLASCSAQWAGRGAALIGLNPLHALFPDNPAHASPYSPSSRLFLNTLYLDVKRIEDMQPGTRAAEMVDSPEFRAHLKLLRDAELVDYPAVAAAKRPILEAFYAQFRERELAADSARAVAFREFCAQRGEDLRRHALFEALQEHLKARHPRLAGWQQWPEEYRDPGSAAVARFAEFNAERIDFFRYLQWQADLQLASAQRHCTGLGMPVGLYIDLAISIDRAGADAWAHQKGYALAASVGAPPDIFNRRGQNWGLPPLLPEALAESGYALLVATLRANMARAGALRIDHVMGLSRLYWIAEDMSAQDGAYVRYPFADMLGIVALESQRNRCLVVGEDLGTVPDELRARLAEAGVLSYRVLMFERDQEGRFRPPAAFPRQALASWATHDLPTLAGFWQGQDLIEREHLGLFPDSAVRDAALLERAQERAALLLALEREGLLPPGMTPDPAATPTMTLELCRAVHRYLASTPSALMLMQFEDVLGMVEQPNLPGTLDEHPNWRRKLSLMLERWSADERFLGLTETVAELRPGRPSPLAGEGAPKGRERGRGFDDAFPSPGLAPAWLARSGGAKPCFAKSRPRPPTALPMGERGVITIPRATYRLQFHRDFRFRDAIGLVPYLDALGISHIYCSPFLRARPGSSHGYDVVDHLSLNPEIGGMEDLDALVAALKARGMGLILDVVPNHMGVMGADNAWWQEVLENGRGSLYAEFFDIDWQPATADLANRLLLPVLGDHYGAVLARGELTLGFEAETGRFSVRYYSHRFPVDPREYPRILERALALMPLNAMPDDAAADFRSLVSAFGHLPARDVPTPEGITERARDKEVHKRHLAQLVEAHGALHAAIDAALRWFNGEPGVPESFDALHELLEAQAYRLAFWRVAYDEINYRRFFDINDLAALRMENELVFETTHRLVFDLLQRGAADGLRIDHPDGLLDPAGYFLRLQEAYRRIPGTVTPAGPRPLYVVIEKISAAFEELPPDWAVHGTTGYRWANAVNGLFVDATAEARFTRLYHSFIGDSTSAEAIIRRSKRIVLNTAMASELTLLSNKLLAIARADRMTRDYTLNTLRRALTEVVAAFPVYRTYIAEQVSPEDRRYVEWAVARAKKTSRAADSSIFDFVQAALLCEIGIPGSALHGDVRLVARKFQQLSAPVTAKGVEDTAFYICNRLISLNEVGGDPQIFGAGVAAFHRYNAANAERWPHGLLASSTHDNKRSEDVRARIDVLSEMPAVWRLQLRRWARINRNRKRVVDGEAAPSRNDEYYLYQILLGSFPVEAEVDLSAYSERVQSHMVKAVREAKLRSSWVNPNAEYEAAVSGFVGAVLSDSPRNLFLRDLRAAAQTVAWFGMQNSLSMTLLKLTSPGVPDIYQGNEIVDLSLTDPDNRRPVDYPLRGRLLAEIGEPGPTPQALSALFASALDGRAKLFLIRRLLELRRQQPQLFGAGDYLALEVAGVRGEHVVAYARRHGERGVIVLAARLFVGLPVPAGALTCGEEVWQDTRVALPFLADDTPLRHVLTGRECRVRDTGLLLAEAFADVPAAVLIYG